MGRNVYCIIGPSGVGKTTLRERAVPCISNLRAGLSTVSRDPRPGEVDGVDYHYVEPDVMRNDIAEGQYIEHVEYHGNLYGFRKDTFETPFSEGCDVMVIIERHGLELLKEYFADSDVTVWSLLILPPDLDTVETRMRCDALRSESLIQKRLATVRQETLATWSKFDSVLVNRDLSEAVLNLKTIIELHRLSQSFVV
jgi:guanylate kinase